ncbi:hypothetical protein M405DRAFT_932695 [Rhizopogon salebrosus TDB-379]|nr:hypothetical protein M405DRAFT_932695 [Rhizopogon salebrosus TDB-379]
MLVPILRAPADRSVSNTTDDSGADRRKGGKGISAGSRMGIFTASQTNVNSRVIFAGGIDLFSDEYTRKELLVHRRATCNSRGISLVEHHHTKPRLPIRIPLTTRFGISDLQLEFTMLDPDTRTSLPPVPGSPGTYQVQFRAPDRHGGFKFVLNWKRKELVNNLG